MKKILVITVLLSSLLVGCNKIIRKEINHDDLNNVDNKVDADIVDNNTTNVNTTDNNSENLESEYFKEISALKFKEMVDSGKNYLFFVGRDTCPACKTFKPTAMKYAKDKKFNIYYVNSTDFATEDWQIIDSIAPIEYIPTILIVNKGKVLYNEHGVKSYDVLDGIVNEYMN